MIDIQVKIHRFGRGVPRGNVGPARPVRQFFSARGLVQAKTCQVLAEYLLRRVGAGVVASPSQKRIPAPPPRASSKGQVMREHELNSDEVFLHKWPYPGAKPPIAVIPATPTKKQRGRKAKNQGEIGVWRSEADFKPDTRAAWTVSGEMWKGLSVRATRNSARLAFLGRSLGYTVRRNRSGNWTWAQISNALKAHSVWEATGLNPAQITEDEHRKAAKAWMAWGCYALKRASAGRLNLYDVVMSGLDPLARRILERLPREF